MQEELIAFLRNENIELVQEKHPKGTLLVTPYEHCHFIFLIDKGAVKVTEWIDEKEQIIRFGYKGNWLTALDSFLSDKPTRFSIETLKSTVVRRIKKNDFLSFVSSSPSIMKKWNVLLENLVLQQMERESDLLHNNPKDRYDRVLQRSPQLFQEIPLRHIANYLRMTPETLSRLRK